MRIHIPALIALIGLSALPASAQTSYPNQRPITIIVPFAAGSGTDTLARILTASMAEGEFKKATFVIENRPGADGIIGALDAAKASNDLGQIGAASQKLEDAVNAYLKLAGQSISGGATPTGTAPASVQSTAGG